MTASFKYPNLLVANQLSFGLMRLNLTDASIDAEAARCLYVNIRQRLHRWFTRGRHHPCDVINELVTANNVLRKRFIDWLLREPLMSALIHILNHRYEGNGPCELTRDFYPLHAVGQNYAAAWATSSRKSMSTLYSLRHCFTSGQTTRISLLPIECIELLHVEDASDFLRFWCILPARFSARTPLLGSWTLWLVESSTEIRVLLLAKLYPYL